MPALRQGRSLMFFAGDSSLDNKHWFFDGFEVKEAQMQNADFTAPALNGYEVNVTKERAEGGERKNLDEEKQKQTIQNDKLLIKLL